MDERHGRSTGYPIIGEEGNAGELAFKIQQAFAMLPEGRVWELVRAMRRENEFYTSLLNLEVGADAE